MEFATFFNYLGVKVTMLEFQNTYIKNPSHFFSPVEADHLENPELILFNYDLALELTGIDFNKYSFFKCV